MTFVPAHSEAANDAALRGAPLAVYDWLLYQLDTQEYRPLKITGVAFCLRVKRHTVTRALRILILRGYLARRYVKGAGYAYRVYPNRRKDEALPAA